MFCKGSSHSLVWRSNKRGCQCSVKVAAILWCGEATREAVSVLYVKVAAILWCGEATREAVGVLYVKVAAILWCGEPTREAVSVL